MIHLVVLAAALLHLQDPAGDAVGDGSLAPPTAPVYANTADFDLESVTVTEASQLTVRVTLGSLGDRGQLPNGFTNPVVEVYLDSGPGGAHALLPGSTMSMPPKRGWNVALRATGDQVYAVTPRPRGDPGSWPHLPATLTTQGNTLVIHTELPRPARADVYALTGVYDPFSKDGWRPLTRVASPWAFSSSTQKAPVVDVLATGMAAQRRAIDSGVLVPYRSPARGVGWLLLVALGLLVAALGLVLRRRVRPEPRRPPAALPPPLPAPEDTHAKRRLPASWGEMPPTEPSFLDDIAETTLWPAASAVAGGEAGGSAADEGAPEEGAPVDGAAEAPREADAEAQREADGEADREAPREADAEAHREADAEAQREAHSEADREAPREADAEAHREADAEAQREADGDADAAGDKEIADPSGSERRA